MSYNIFVIRHLTSGFVLDASEENVRLDYYTGSPFQKWVMETVESGFSVFVNTGNGKALDIQVTDEESNIITYMRHDGTNQQWLINAEEKTIESAESGLTLDVFQGEYVPGNKIIAFEKSGQDNQQFYLQNC